jgi:hypothetical protein
MFLKYKNKIYLPIELFATDTNDNKIKNSKTKPNDEDVLLFMLSLDDIFLFKRIFEENEINFYILF